MDQIFSMEVNEFFEKRKQNFKDTDLFKILNRLKVYPQKDFWIAGGSVRKAITGEPLETSDIDCFFGTRQMYKQVNRSIRGHKEIKKNYSHFSFIKNYYIEETVFRSYDISFGENKDLRPWMEKAYVVEEKVSVADVQLINFKYYPDVETLLRGFDFTVCQFAFDGEKIYFGANSLGDLMFKKLRFNCTKNRHSIVNKRYRKYTDKGFTPTLNTAEIYENLAEYVRNNRKHEDADIDYMSI